MKQTGANYSVTLKAMLVQGLKRHQGIQVILSHIKLFFQGTAALHPVFMPRKLTTPWANAQPAPAISLLQF